jgi:L-ascorbate metabolism protein UlaG (beta-lactamase superfamily)
MTIRKTLLPALGAIAASLLVAACGTSNTPAVSAPATPIIISTTAPAPTQVAADKVMVQWLGQAATKITTPGGKVIVIDPWLTTNPKTPEGFKRLEALGKVDLILVTHAHTDHFADAPALAQLNNAPVYGPAGLNQSMVHLGMLPANLSPRFNKGGTITPIGPNIKITATHAQHSSELVWRNPATGKEETHVGGEAMGFIIELENGFKIYHMGDTGLFGDMRLIGDYYQPDLVLIPIGGHFVMDPKDAATATVNMLKPKYAIPIHYGTSPQLKGTPAEYISAIGNAPVRVVTMNPGEAYQF